MKRSIFSTVAFSVTVAVISIVVFFLPIPAAALGSGSTYAVVYGYRFWTAIGLRGACFPLVVNCQAVLLGCLTVCHVGVLCIHLVKRGGCNGIGAWLFNSVLNAVISLLYLKFYVKTRSLSLRKQ